MTKPRHPITPVTDRIEYDKPTNRERAEQCVRQWQQSDKPQPDLVDRITSLLDAKDEEADRWSTEGT